MQNFSVDQFLEIAKEKEKEEKKILENVREQKSSKAQESLKYFGDLKNRSYQEITAKCVEVTPMSDAEFVSSGEKTIFLKFITDNNQVIVSRYFGKSYHFVEGTTYNFRAKVNKHHYVKSRDAYETHISHITDLNTVFTSSDDISF